MSEHPSPSNADGQQGSLPPQQDESHSVPPEGYGGNPQRISGQANPHQYLDPPQDSSVAQHQYYPPGVVSGHPDPFTQHPVHYALQGNPLQGTTFEQPQGSGRKKALVVGINYYGQHGELPNCVRDARNMLQFLVQSHGFRREDIVVLTDDQQALISQPVRANILRAMRWLVNDARPGDSLLFHYAGHSGRAETGDGTEPDGLHDEVICPVDFRQAGHITDDEMHGIMVQLLPPGARLTAIFDSSHTRNALDLPHDYSSGGILKVEESAPEIHHAFHGIIAEIGQERLSGLASRIMGFVGETAERRSTGAYDLTTTTNGALTNVVVFFGKKTGRTWARSTAPTPSTSALSGALIAALKKNPRQNCGQLLRNIEDELSILHLEPHLACSYPLDLASLWLCSVAGLT